MTQLNDTLIDEQVIADAHTMLDGFATHYRYDVGYLRELLETDPIAFKVFEAFLPMASYQGDAPTDVVFVAKLAAMRLNDCGACLQLTIRQALESGVPVEVVRAAAGTGQELPLELTPVYRLVQAAHTYAAETQTHREAVRTRHGEGALAAIALVVAAAGVFPTMKRLLGTFESCALMDFEFSA